MKAMLMIYKALVISLIATHAILGKAKKDIPNIPSSTPAQHNIGQELTAFRAELAALKIKARKEKPKKLKKAASSYSGFIYRMPNKVTITTSSPDKGFLVNNSQQQIPVIIQDNQMSTVAANSKKLFYAGSFNDPIARRVRYAYISRR